MCSTRREILSESYQINSTLNRKTVITSQILNNLTRFRKDFSACDSLNKIWNRVLCVHFKCIDKSIQSNSVPKYGAFEITKVILAVQRVERVSIIINTFTWISHFYTRKISVFIARIFWLQIFFLIKNGCNMIDFDVIFRCNLHNLQNHWTLEVFRKMLQIQT